MIPTFDMSRNTCLTSNSLSNLELFHCCLVKCRYDGPQLIFKLQVRAVGYQVKTSNSPIGTSSETNSRRMDLQKWSPRLNGASVLLTARNILGSSTDTIGSLFALRHLQGGEGLTASSITTLGADESFCEAIGEHWATLLDLC